ncbi:MAG: precorrin-2 C(20)-methyltransferase [Oscillospiraceae bacterium]|jgi:precorrin-2/cobalt-factor-2 C20-methyltransferase|nr:precorrin-2 C(20)-methyltransferase [Oscillospiraceae bacterium]
MKGIFYGVGVGPGDPELLTIKAVRTLAKADVIAAPERENGHTALDIAAAYIHGKEILHCPSPMSSDKYVIGGAYDITACTIAKELESGRSAAFVTLGDPSVYSAFLYIRRRVKALGYETVTIPGITSFCAAAAALGEGLCEDDEPLLILPSAAPDEYIDLPVTKVLMKQIKALPLLSERFSQRGADVSAVTKCGMTDERISRGAESLKDVSEYFTLVIVKEPSAISRRNDL